MPAKLIDGKKMAEEARSALALEVAALSEKAGRKPCLAAVLVGGDPASKIYVNMKRKAAEEAGMVSKVVSLPEAAKDGDIAIAIRELDQDESVDGIMVQLPLPKHVDVGRVLEQIDPGKDVDGLTSHSLGLLASKKQGFIPATAKGVMRLIASTGIGLQGKRAVVVGESIQVGRPIALLLLNEFATVTVAHVHTKNLSEITAEADVLVVAVGKPGLVKGDMVKPGAVVIDVGTTKVGGRLLGDVDFSSVSSRAGWLTPVPGGVGPMTVASLLENTLEAFRRRVGVRTGKA